MAKQQPEFNFQNDLKQANKIENLQERLLFLKKCLKIFNQDKATNWGLDLDGYGEQLQEEINYVQDLIISQPKQQAKQPVKDVQPVRRQNKLDF